MVSNSCEVGQRFGRQNATPFQNCWKQKLPSVNDTISGSQTMLLGKNIKLFYDELKKISKVWRKKHLLRKYLLG